MGFLEPAGVGILVVDSGGKVAYSNPVYRGYFGLPADYFESRPLFSDSIRAWAEAEGLAEGETAEILRDFAGRLASSRTVRFRGRCLRVQTLPLPGGGLLLLYVDITEAEELRRKSELDARLLSTVIESAPCFIAYLDRDLRFVFANSTYATQFGRPIGEIVGKEYRQLLAPEVAAEREFVAGMQVWNFADFAAVQSIMRVAGVNHKGVFTRTRTPKMAAHVLREFWAR